MQGFDPVVVGSIENYSIYTADLSIDTNIW